MQEEGEPGACKEIGNETPDSMPCDLEELIHIQRKSAAMLTSIPVVVAKYSIIEGSVLFESVAETGDIVATSRCDVMPFYDSKITSFSSLMVVFVT